MSHSTKCPSCDSVVFDLLHELDKWTVMKCQICGLGITIPFPSEQTLDELYGKRYFSDKYPDIPTQVSDEERRMIIKHERHRVNFIRKGCRNGKLLDIGCGNGHFVYASSRKGFDATGFDITKTNKKHITDQLGVKFLSGDLEEIALEYGHKFDAITMWHTLEHHRNPALTLRTCHKLLTTGGTVAIEVPNHGTLDARYYKKSWSEWDVPFHLFHFTKQSLCSLIEAKGFRIIKVRSYPSEFVKESILKVLPIKTIARVAATITRGGGSVAVLAQKKDSRLK